MCIDCKTISLSCGDWNGWTIDRFQSWNGWYLLCRGRDNTYLFLGPCYRCLFPVAPPSQACPSCSAAGVLGPVPGLLGVMQAIEAIKILSGVKSYSLIV